MIVYFDTSAFVPLLVAEPGSKFCRRLWDDANAVTSCRLLYVEAAAALAQALRLERLTVEGHRSARGLLDHLWDQVDVVELDDELAHRAAWFAYACELRSYDAAHCAAADQLGDPELVVASGDRRLLQACSKLGLAVADVNEP